MKKKYIEPIVTLLNYATEDIIMASFDDNNSADFNPDWLD